MKILVFLVLLVAGFFGCNKKNSSPIARKGVYVEVFERKDTIEFINIDGTDFLHLGSSKRNATGIPIYTTGLFTYKLKQDSILLQWMARSSIATEYHYFKMNSDRAAFTLGNFYKTDMGAERLMFKRLR